jgi:hypothetical protein
MTVTAVTRAGGPSIPTQREWRAGRIPLGPNPQVVRNYETALKWPEGHIDRLLAGDVVVRETAPVAAEMDVWKVSSDLLRSLMGQIDSLRDQAADNPNPAEVRRIAGEMTALQADILMQVLSLSKQDPPPQQAAATTDETSGSGGFSM